MYSKWYYSISVRLTVILTVEEQTSGCNLSNETKTMHILQMVQEQHAIYFGYAFLGVLGKFYRNLKGLNNNNYVIVFYIIPFTHSSLVLNPSKFLSFAEHKCYFKEGGKANSCWSSVGVDRLSAPILSILPIIDIGHFQNRFADIFNFFLL